MRRRVESPHGASHGYAVKEADRVTDANETETSNQEAVPAPGYTAATGLSVSSPLQTVATCVARLMSPKSELMAPELFDGGLNQTGMNDSRQAFDRDRSEGVFEQKGLRSWWQSVVRGRTTWALCAIA